MISKDYYIYILASSYNGVLYIGVMNDLIKRVWEHKNGIKCSFTKKYNIKILVYYETYEHIINAITREKQLKKWYRKWKIELIEKFNPEWRDLYHELHP